MVSLQILFILAGALVVGGLATAILSGIPRPGRLDDLIRQLDAGASTPGQTEATEARAVLLGDPGSPLERAAVLAYRRLHLPLSPATQRLLALRGRSISDFFVQKLILAAAGLIAPLLAQAANLALGLGLGAIPAVVSLAGCLVGYFWPDLALRRSQTHVHRDAEAAMGVFFDLVILERLGNASATQALRRAAGLCDVALFVRIRGALEHARLQQRPPWAELHKLASELELPQLGDIADVLSLDEQGAALAGALRARVAELRHAHLAKEKIAAQQDTEAMTIWMVIPVLAFALLFLGAPLLKITAAG